MLANRNAWYPVLHRGVKIVNDSIYLLKDEVWKYGKTINGVLVRYPGFAFYIDNKFYLNQSKLRYKVQFVGTEQECIAEEKRKIYNYPLLPECLKRKRKLIRPPGNKIDN